jgi:hypothetical protein
MPDPNAIVSTTIRLEPLLDRAPAEILGAEAGLPPSANCPSDEPCR